MITEEKTMPGQKPPFRADMVGSLLRPQALKEAREKLAGLDDAVIGQAREAAKAADEYVREHPWGAVGIAAVAGLLVGVMISRR